MTPPRKKRKWFSIRSLWRLRYRMYAIIVMIVLVPILYASNSGIPPQIDVIGFETVSSNVLFDEIERITYDLSDLGSTTPDTNNPETRIVDRTGRDLTAALKAAGYDLGFISSDAFVDLGIKTPGNKKEEVPIDQAPPREQTLDDLIARPSSPQRTNFLRYPKYNINAPIIYSSLEDLFNLKPNCDKNTDPQGCLDFANPRDNGPVDSPIQRKLQDGIVHIAFTPQPGETGNSYIVGHSSNYSWVPSAYNAVFKPLERRSQVGEEFFIYDRFGRELKFRVFEAIEISENDTATAYRTFEGKRVVTLQTSILEFVPGQGFQPTKRWLTRGELVLE